jgi:hypothetical protein
MVDNEHSSNEFIKDFQEHKSTPDEKSINSKNEEEFSEKLIDTMTNRLKFQHIYNGMVFIDNDKYYCLAEFKIICPDIESSYLNTQQDKNKYGILFNRVNFKCGWFYVDAKNQKLVGPFEFDVKKFTDNNERYINFYSSHETYEKSNIVEITNIDNNTENLIDNDDLPYWMKRDLLSNTIVMNLNDSSNS